MDSSAASLPRRRSASDLQKDAEEPSAAAPDVWLDDEVEAVNELKRGAIAAQFPEEFSLDTDILNGASNVWLPARLHPEIAPGEFQEWLKTHGSQLSKMEDTVNRRKSILSYSYKDEDRPSRPAGGGGSLRRRNTTGLVRRKTFVERVEEEEEEGTPFLVQSTQQRSSLKRSKLANKRRDSTASNSGSGRRRRNGSTTTTAGPSPLGTTAHGEVSNDGGGQPPRMSTAEILKQVTVAVDDFGFDDFELGDMPAASMAQQNGAAVADMQPLRDAPSVPDTKSSGEKTVTHKKSGSSWWQWGKDDYMGEDSRGEHPPPRKSSSTGGSVPLKPKTLNRNEPPHPTPVQPSQTAPASSQMDTSSSSLKDKLSFLKFNRKNKKDKRQSDESNNLQEYRRQQRQASRAPPAAAPAAPSVAPANHPPVVAPATKEPPTKPAHEYNEEINRETAKEDNAGQQIPSILTPVRPPPTRMTSGSNRLPIHIERAIYRLASIKLANPRRPLLQQVLLTNMMFWYLEIINPRSQQQQQQQQQHQQQQQQQQASPPASPQQSQDEPTVRAGSPQPIDTSQQQRRSKGPQNQHRRRDENHRRRSGGSNNTQTGERVVMRSPQYERQQQQIYSGNNNHQYYQQQSANPHDMDEDDDVPLALYRGNGIK